MQMTPKFKSLNSISFRKFRSKFLLTSSPTPALPPPPPPPGKDSFAGNLFNNHELLEMEETLSKIQFNSHLQGKKIEAHSNIFKATRLIIRKTKTWNS